MSQKATTKDELFLLKLLELALQLGNDPHHPLERLTIGRAIGQNDRGTHVITRDLLQANFIKKAGEEAVSLTAHGLRLTELLTASR